MNTVLFSLLQSLLMTAALSTDALVASISYGTERIKIPPLSAFIISFICSAMLGLSLLGASVLSPYIPKELAHTISFWILFCLGIFKLFEFFFKNAVKRLSEQESKLKIKLFDATFLLSVYADSKKADRDRSRKLSPLEAVSLAVALSLDGLAAGFGAGLIRLSVINTVLVSLVVTLIAVYGGCFIGKRLAKAIPFDISFLGGALLLLLAFLR